MVLGFGEDKRMSTHEHNDTAKLMKGFVVGLLVVDFGIFRQGEDKDKCGVITRDVDQ